MVTWKLIFGLAFALCLTACPSNSRPETRLLGKWQSEASPGKLLSLGSPTEPPRPGKKLFSPWQLEFFADGTVAKNQKLNERWEQVGTGTFKFIDPAHVKIDWGWLYGATICDVDWLDSDHIRLRAADDTVQFHRVN